MAVLSVRPKRNGVSRSQTRDWKRTYQSVYVVETDSQYTGPVAVAAAVPVLLGSQWQYPVGSAVSPTEFDDFAYCQQVDCRQDSEDGRQWEVTCSYGPWDPTQWPESPLDQPPRVQWSSVQWTEPLLEDNQGNAVVNSAGDRYDPPLERDRSRMVLTVSRNEPSFDPSTAELYTDAVNTDSFYQYDPGQCKVAKIAGERLFDNTIGWYWQVDYEVHTHPEGWTKKTLDCGFNQVVGGVKKAIQVDGKAAQDAQLLDGGGLALAQGSAPFVQEYHVYKEMDFAPLQLEFPGP